MGKWGGAHTQLMDFTVVILGRSRSFERIR